ncbi:MAG: FAD:protein FMN transferase, partial [Paludibacter sp.]|nr:FAD:protein FMN transferase [Paludibacter sp.]
MNNRFSTGIFVATLAVTVLLAACNNQKKHYIHNQVHAQGTYYSAIYSNPQNEDLQAQIEDFFAKFDASLSNYNPNSTISKINRNEDSLRTDSLFETMFCIAQKISEQSNGAFDITVAPL